MYLDRFGPEDYRKVREIRTWLHSHPRGNSLLAYLSDRDPYQG